MAFLAQRETRAPAAGTEGQTSNSRGSAATSACASQRSVTINRWPSSLGAFPDPPSVPRLGTWKPCTSVLAIKWRSSSFIFAKHTLRTSGLLKAMSMIMCCIHSQRPWRNAQRWRALVHSDLTDYSYAHRDLMTRRITVLRPPDRLYPRCGGHIVYRGLPGPFGFIVAS
jgi:hypothetical protein